MRKPCCEKKTTNKGAWSKQEDVKLTQYIQKHGEGSWRSLPVAAGTYIYILFTTSIFGQEVHIYIYIHV